MEDFFGKKQSEETIPMDVGGITRIIQFIGITRIPLWMLSENSINKETE